MNKNYEYLNQAHAESALKEQREIIFKDLLATASTLLDKGYNPVTIAEEFASRAGMLACISSATSNYTKQMAISVLREIMIGVVNNMTEQYDELKREITRHNLNKTEDSIFNNNEETYWKP